MDTPQNIVVDSEESATLIRELLKDKPELGITVILESNKSDLQILLVEGRHCSMLYHIEQLIHSLETLKYNTPVVKLLEEEPPFYVDPAAEKIRSRMANQKLKLLRN